MNKVVSGRLTKLWPNMICNLSINQALVKNACLAVVNIGIKFMIFCLLCLSWI